LISIARIKDIQEFLEEPGKERRKRNDE